MSKDYKFSSVSEMFRSIYPESQISTFHIDLKKFKTSKYLKNLKKLIKTMDEAHEATKNSKLRFD